MQIVQSGGNKFFLFFSGTSPMLPRPAQLMRWMAFANAWIKLVDGARSSAADYAVIRPQWLPLN
jgi:hypothetical protein